MELSQGRTREVLFYCLRIIKGHSVEHCNWAQSQIIGAGMSSSRLIVNKDGSENSESSRRVEFRVRTKADEKLSLILEQSEGIKK